MAGFMAVAELVDSWSGLEGSRSKGTDKRWSRRCRLQGRCCSDPTFSVRARVSFACPGYPVTHSKELACATCAMRACTSISIGGSSSSRSSSSNCQVQQAAGFQRHFPTCQTRGTLLSAFFRLHPTGIARQRGLLSACSETGAVSGTTGVEAQQEFKLQQHGQLEADVEVNPELQPDHQPSDQQPGQELPPAASQAAADLADLAGDSIAAAGGDGTNDSSSAEPPWEMQNCYNYTFYWPQVTEPVPVQMPPQDACMEPTRTWFGKSRYRSPTFLEFYPTPPKSTYNFMSFLGDIEANRGKFLAAGQQKDQFLTSYFKALSLKNRRMYIAECYQGQPFK